MSIQTSKLALTKPSGNEANTRANYNALIDQIDTAAMKDVFYCKSAIYNSGTSKIDVTIGSGTIVFLQTIVTKSTDSVYSISTPAINTSYYVYLSNAGVFNSNTTGVEVDGAIMIWKIIVGATLATITTLDLRSVVSGSAQAVKDLLDAHAGTGGSAHANVIAAGVAGFMTGADKTKLDGVAVGATNYVHPSTHPASIILQDASNRFATDTEKATWNAKADNSALTAHLADYTLQIPYAVAAGAVNVYTATLAPALTAYTAGVALSVNINITNTGAATINVNALGAKSIKDTKGNLMTAGKLRATSIYTLRYNGTDFILQGDLEPFMDATSSIQSQLNAKLNSAGGTLLGPLALARNELQQPKIKDYSEALATNATSTGAVTLDISNGNNFDNTLTGATTFTFSNPAASGQACSFTLILRQGVTAYAVTWPSSVKWANDVIPDVSAVSKTSVLTFITVNGGTRWYGFLGATGLVT